MSIRDQIWPRDLQGIQYVKATRGSLSHILKRNEHKRKKNKKKLNGSYQPNYMKNNEES